MNGESGENVYSIYTDDDDVCWYDTLEYANQAVRRRRDLVEVKGPFIHYRVEYPLICTSVAAVRELRRIVSRVPLEVAIEIEQVANALEASTREVFPLQSLRLPSGELIDVHSDSLHNSSE